MILKNAYFSIDGVDLSDKVKQLSFDRSIEVQDTTTMGSNSRTKEPGLKDASGSVTFLQGYGAGSVEATLDAAFGEIVPFEFRAKNDAVSADNPSFTGNLIITSLNPVAGGVGESQEAPINFDVTGDVTRATA